MLRQLEFQTQAQTLAELPWMALLSPPWDHVWDPRLVQDPLPASTEEASAWDRRPHCQAVQSSQLHWWT